MDLVEIGNQYVEDYPVHPHQDGLKCGQCGYSIHPDHITRAVATNGLLIEDVLIYCCPVCEYQHFVAAQILVIHPVR